VTLNIFDSKTQQIESFAPLQAGAVNIYVCGPTVQSAPHVGHLRSAVAFDIVANWLRIGHNLKVTVARNVTDIDDKILVNAAEQGEDWRQLAVDVEQIFNAVYDDLGAGVDLTPHATEHIGDMIALIETLISRGHAYQAADGSPNVFFDTASWSGYGELTNQKLENMVGEEVVSHGRRSANDFALWKAAKADEPATACWSSPWGKGRPGWHIECSAMTHALFGETFDIHGGGLDLRFPHHENELAQSRAAGFAFAKHWMHNGLVTVGGQKMSKSLGNGVSVELLFEQGSRAAIRYWLGSAHYRSTLDYSPAAITDAAAAVARVQNFLKRAVATAQGAAAADIPVGFATAMDNDFNVSEALGVLHDTVREGNAKLDANHDASGEAAQVLVMAEVLGFNLQDEQVVDAALASQVESLIEQRRQARADKNFSRADEIRDELANLGVAIEDTANGTTWSLNG
jgi:cysteinyl-tRNA synthetase